MPFVPFMSFQFRLLETLIYMGLWGTIHEIGAMLPIPKYQLETLADAAREDRHTPLVPMNRMTDQDAEEGDLGD